MLWNGTNNQMQWLRKQKKVSKFVINVRPQPEAALKRDSLMVQASDLALKAKSKQVLRGCVFSLTDLVTS